MACYDVWGSNTCCANDVKHSSTLLRQGEAKPAHSGITLRGPSVGRLEETFSEWLELLLVISFVLAVTYLLPV
jgi:hypothetical protein